MKRKVALMFITILLSINLLGCFNYKDINRTIFVTAIGIDVDDVDNYTFYVETFIPSRGEQIEVGDEKKTLLKVSSKSIFEAARNLSLMTNYVFSYSQCRGIIFTEKAAEHGLDSFLDLFIRSQSLPLRAYIFITPESIETLISATMDEEKYTGIFLSELAFNSDFSSRGTKIRIDEYLNNRLLGEKVVVANIIELNRVQQKQRISITGLAVVKDDKLESRLDPQESMAFNFFHNTFKQGTISVVNPDHSDSVVTLEVLRSITKSQVNYNGEKIELKVIIKPDAVLAFSEKSVDITNSEKRNEIIKKSEEYIKKICKQLFSNYKEKNIDIFNVKRMMNMKYPRDKVKDCLKITELEVKVDLDLKGSIEIMNFQ